MRYFRLRKRVRRAMQRMLAAGRFGDAGSLLTRWQLWVTRKGLLRNNEHGR